MIDLDFTAIVQAVNFLLILWFLNRFIFKPMLRTADKRRKEIENLNRKAESATGRLGEAMTGYDNSLKAIHHKSSQIVAVAKKEALEQASSIQTKAMERYKESVDQASAEIDKEVDTASETLKKQIGWFAGSLAGKILGRRIS